jgi:hypothetical protein
MKMWKNDHQLSEDLAKSPYKPDMKYKHLINLLCLLLHTEK